MLHCELSFKISKLSERCLVVIVNTYTKAVIHASPVCKHNMKRKDLENICFSSLSTYRRLSNLFSFVGYHCLLCFVISLDFFFEVNVV